MASILRPRDSSKKFCKTDVNSSSGNGGLLDRRRIRDVLLLLSVLVVLVEVVRLLDKE